MVESIGWPTEAKVGKTASTAAFMIVQHSSDLSLQKTFLDTIKHYALTGEISARSYAYLADRVSLRSSGKQLYGTQVLKQSDGTHSIAPYEDLQALLRGRENYKLGDWNAYLQRFGLF